MVKLSQTFVTYHNCGHIYMDGTRTIVPKNEKCVNPTYEPFWKKAIDVNNKTETRNELKYKRKAKLGYVRSYFKVVNNSKDFFQRSYFRSDEDSTLDDESLNNESLIANANTDQYLSTLEEETGDSLVIDENKSRDSFETQTNLISNTQNCNKQ